MVISVNIVDFLIISLALQGLVSAAMLLYSSKKINSNRWLGAFIFLIAYLTLTMEVFKSGEQDTHQWLWFLLPQLRMAIGPLAYFYTRSLLYGHKKLKGSDYFHFSGLIFEIGAQLLYVLHINGHFLNPLVQKVYYFKAVQFYFFGGSNFENLPAFLSLIIYSAVCYKAIRKSQFNLQLSAFKLKDVKWLKNLLYILLALNIVWFISLVAGYIPQGQSFWNFYILYIPIVVSIHWLGMAAYVRQSKMADADVLAYNKPPIKVYYQNERADQYHQQLVYLMETERAYLNPLLKLDRVAEKLGVPEKMISSLLNQYMGKNFNDFINEYRVQEARDKLIDPAFRQFTIAAIAYDCGFNSLATFQRCFKQFTGITPSQYQNGLSSVILP